MGFVGGSVNIAIASDLPPSSFMYCDGQAVSEMATQLAGETAELMARV